MEISIHTSGLRTLIGKKSDEGIEIKVVDSRLIFQEPKLLHDRLMVILQKKLGLKAPKEITRMIFGLSGIMHTPSGSVIHSHVLNEISNGKGYSGYSFRNLFGYLNGEENIHVVNDAVPIGLGFQKLYPAISKPLLVLLIEIGVGVSIINDQGEIISTELAANNIPGYNEMTANYLLSQGGVDELLHSASRDILKEYTQMLIKTASFYRNISDNIIYTTHLKEKVRLNVCVLSKKDEYLDVELLRNNDTNLEFILPATEDEKIKIPILGLFAYPDYKSPIRTVQRIEYYSREEKIYTFDTYEDFAKHWEQVKSFANPDNEYRIFYSDGVVRPVKMREINYRVELEAYKF